MRVVYRMPQKILGDFGINRREFLLVFGLIFNVFTWHLFSYSLIEKIIIDTEMMGGSVIWGAFYLSIITFSIIGAVVSKRVNRLKFLKYWILFGVIASLLPVLINDFTPTNLAVVSAILGASFGIGMPSCLSFFTEATKVDNRGRVAAITFIIATIVAPLLRTVTFGDLSFSTLFIICAIWRGTGLIVQAIKPKKHESQEVIKASFVSILRSRPFLLYFAAWAMFCLVNAMETPIVTYALESNETPSVETMETIEPIFGLLFILIAGFMSDLIGRKKIVLAGFVSLGAAYAIIGFLPDALGEISWYLYFVVDGAAWGIFYIAFVFILWGDLSQHSSKEKYYALGSIPFFLSDIIPHLITIDPESIIPGFAFSVAAFFLFLAVLSLIYAPETLPEKKMELRRLRSFAEEAQKAKEKYERKTEK